LARPTLRPTRPLAQPACWPCCPRRPKPPRPTHLARTSVTSSREYIFPFGSRLPSWLPLLSSLCQVWPSCQFCLPPTPTDHCRFLPSPPATPRHPTSDPEMPGEVFTPHLDSPSMVLRPLPSAISPSPAPVCPPPATIKGRGAPPGHHHTHPTLNRVLPSPQHPLHRASPPSIVPHRRSVVSDPPPPSLTASEAHLRPLSIFPQPR
jgi:hypothetical protein